ncbi:Aste57867_13601 [Aphanomyces stellatus]|uniref:Aste57867_13601 protein n=1 Tax=Aphanomyces stellatus TaxID=120398 RepID=A0A485KYK1_9STRA|nr:hypothetical protein As57867_013551 [Aphanomyces stellatus]VFT90438.1 Aste57867_13601 [Aphanomyces stellatus]
MLERLLHVLVEGDDLACVATQTLSHLTYSIDACKTMVALGLAETLASILTVAPPLMQHSALELLGRLTDQVPSAVCRLLRPRFLQALVQVDVAPTDSHRLRLLGHILSHPKAPSLPSAFSQSVPWLNVLVTNPVLSAHDTRLVTCIARHLGPAT